MSAADPYRPGFPELIVLIVLVVIVTGILKQVGA